MFADDTDREWERFGQCDPYFGVWSAERFRRANLSAESREEFFESGHDYIQAVLNNIRLHIDPGFTIKRALDFGCGVGRLVIPLARVAEEVTGVDVSDSMLAEAKNNCAEHSIENAVFVKSDDDLSLLKGKYDFIHSFIVFQHIPATRGEKIFVRLMERLEDGGVGVLHFTYRIPNSTSSALLLLVRKYVPLTKNLMNLIKGRPFHYPGMEMHSYSINHLVLAMQQAHIPGCYTEFTDHGGSLGILVYFKKPKSAPPQLDA